jgi:hypothetical protein
VKPKKLDRADIISGYPAKKIRDFLGHARSGAFSYNDYREAERFHEIATEYFSGNAQAVIAELIHARLDHQRQRR